MFNPSNVDFNRIATESTKAIQDFQKQVMAQQPGAVQSMAQAFHDYLQAMSQDPERLMQMQVDMYQGYLKLWANMAERLLGNSPAPLIRPEKGDRRFSGEDWESQLPFDFIKQSYLLTCDFVLKHIRHTPNVDADTRQKVDFYTRQFLDAISPSNFVMTNPEVLKATMETKGENLVNGLKNLLEDLQRSQEAGGGFRIAMTDYDAFTVGKNIATAEGDVVFRNRMFELIQYKAKTEKVGKTPLLICPPWINKFYILDLKPENSFIKYAVEECGQTVYLISWKNPDASYRDVGFDTYMQEGVLEALRVVTELTGEPQINAIGYCIGGTLLTATLAYMAKKKDNRIKSATFFTTLIDFEEAGELQVFIDEVQVAELEKKMAEKGYLDGAEMAQTFSLLRSNDLIWSFVVNNYLMGKDPFPFDILYWNDDATRMPEKMHSYYLRNMYLENNLIKPGKLILGGEKIDVRHIDLPVYMVSTQQDHIVPWESCFRAVHLLKGDVTFILGSSGHVAGVINPPSKKKGNYWKAQGSTGSAAEWQKNATENPGSWWADWQQWIAAQSDALVPARKQAKSLAAAPGTYVVEK